LISLAAMAAIHHPPERQPFFHRPRFDSGPGSYRPRGGFYRPPHGGRFRPPGYHGVINDGSRPPRPWLEHRPGYTPSNQGRATRKSAHRKTIDYNATVLKTLQNRMYLRDSEETAAILPDVLYINDLTTPSEMRYNPINCVTTKFVRQSTNKVRCPIFCVAWTPEGRRLVTGASSGEFTLWNGLTFNFETILQAHDTSVRAMVWSHDNNWMITGDHNGYVKYWQSNMNNVKAFQAHKEALRGLSFCPTDHKFASCSDDGSVRVFDFAVCVEERILKGHGADVKCVDWHPQKSIIVSGSKDSQQPIKLWDARTGTSLATIHAHKSTVMSMKWNKNGNWFLTASRDHLLKLFDIRNMRSDFQTFKGHQKEATVVSWHPVYEDFFASGGSDGAIKFWNVGTDKEVGSNDTAHDGFIWSMAWHPLGHILVTGSNDHSTKFWARNKPGDTMKDRYNLNLLPIEDELDDASNPNHVHIGGASSSSAGMSGIVTGETTTELPGMGIDDEMIEQIRQANSKSGIPGLDMDGKNMSSETFIQTNRKYTYTKKIDRSFAAAWEGKAQLPPSMSHHHRGAHESSSGPSLLGDHPGSGGDNSTDRPPPLMGGLLEHPNNRAPLHLDNQQQWNSGPPPSHHGGSGPPPHHGGSNPNNNFGPPRGAGPGSFNPRGPPPVIKEQHKDFTVGPRIDFKQFNSGSSNSGGDSKSFPSGGGGPGAGGSGGGGNIRGQMNNYNNQNQQRGAQPGGFQGGNNFTGPRMDFRGPRPDFRGPRPGNPGQWNNRNNESGPRMNWNGPGGGRGAQNNHFRPY